MIKSIIIAFTFFASALFVLSTLPNSVVLAQDAGDAVCDTIGQATGNGCESVNQSGSSISSVIAGALNLLTFVAGVATVIMVIIAGFKYLTSQGDASSVSNAKSTLLYALIGIVIVVLSQTIIFFFINSATPDTTQPQQVNCPAGEVCRQ
jgi:hypothetical protein